MLEKRIAGITLILYIKSDQNPCSSLFLISITLYLMCITLYVWFGICSSRRGPAVEHVAAGWKLVYVQVDVLGSHWTLLVRPTASRLLVFVVTKLVWSF